VRASQLIASTIGVEMRGKTKSESASQLIAPTISVEMREKTKSESMSGEAMVRRHALGPGAGHQEPAPAPTQSAIGPGTMPGPV